MNKKAEKSKQNEDDEINGLGGDVVNKNINYKNKNQSKNINYGTEENKNINLEVERNKNINYKIEGNKNIQIEEDEDKPNQIDLCKKINDKMTSLSQKNQ